MVSRSLESTDQLSKSLAHSHQDLSFVEGLSKQEILQDYLLAYQSRQLSLLGRKEVLGGKAKFGIFGDGKEVAQIALARHVRAGDWRAGYYRDQTWMLATGLCDLKSFFSQLYADPHIAREPSSGGRQMNAHFASRFLDSSGNWTSQLQDFQSAADASPTASQMARLLGLAYASKYYRAHSGRLDFAERFSNHGDEVAFGSIGDASTSEGIFWETLNAAGVLQVPIVLSVWDDGFGISVPRKFQTTNDSISRAAAGFSNDSQESGWVIREVNAWDYPALLAVYQEATRLARQQHKPVLVHVKECTQPQGHSTSGSHERYKSSERLLFEEDYDCVTRMRHWLLESGISTSEKLDAAEKEAFGAVRSAQKQAWDEFLDPLLEKRGELLEILEHDSWTDPTGVAEQMAQLRRLAAPKRRDLLAVARKILLQERARNQAASVLASWVDDYQSEGQKLYSDFLYVQNDSKDNGLTPALPTYNSGEQRVDGRILIQKCFAEHLQRDPRLFIIGEDVGQLGGVNLEFEGLSAEFGAGRVTDTGIREATILGQGIGAAMRGLRPIVDIQYLDYLLYCFQVLSDDLATLHYRSAGGQMAPVIIRTKGHRLEGIWHTGSPMAMILGGCRGVYVGVPRNMTQAVGMYNWLMKREQSALVIEVLNAYRNKELLPDSISGFALPFGVVEVLRSGKHLTLLTYGACVKLAEQSCEILSSLGIEVELIDAQTLLPFDLEGQVAISLAKTNALLILDEDVPGGASAYLLQQVIEGQRAYEHLDSPPITLSAREHRAAYGSDGDYFSKPSIEDICETVYAIMHERDPSRFP